MSRARSRGARLAIVSALVALATVAAGCRQSGAPPAPPASGASTEVVTTTATASTETSPARAQPAGPALVTKLAPFLVATEWEQLPTKKKVVALTFDAGGDDASVASILSTLEEKGVRATFFMTGRWVEAYPADAQAIAARHSVGNHTYSHPHLTQLSDDALKAEVKGAAAVLHDTLAVDARPLFRFPYGDRDSRTIGLVNDLGYGSIRWTVDTLGWKGAAAGQSVDTIRDRVLDGLQPGAIVLMHVGAANDGTTLDADALPSVIDDLRARGYEPVDVYRYAARYASTADDATARFSASTSWQTGSWNELRYGATYHAASPAKLDDPARFRLRVPQTARFRVLAWWPSSASYNGAARIALDTADGRRVVVVDERSSGARWAPLGTYVLPAGDAWVASVLRRSSGTGRIVADALRLTSVTPP